MDHITTTNTDTSPASDHEPASVLAALRALLPNRQLQLSEALRLAELQADRLLRLRGITGVPVPLEVVSALPRITIELDPLLARHDASGVSDWDPGRRTWVIGLNPEEPTTRQRFTVIHEYKHILDYGHPGLARPLPTSVFGLHPVEYLADYFAGCVLMPKRWVKAAYFDGIQHRRDLAELFDVSPRAMQVRLGQLGIARASDQPEPSEPRYRLQPAARRASSTRHRYHRLQSRNRITAPSRKETTT